MTPANTLLAEKQQGRVRNADRIAAKRAHLMAELGQLRDSAGSPKIIENVQQLLTRWWSPASWHAREELLKTAEWFLQLEKTGGRAVDAAQKHLAVSKSR
jgi:hypothetical protein